MSLIEQINADFMTAYKASIKDESKKIDKNFLGLLKSEVTKDSKNPEDKDVISKIKSMIKGAASTNSLSELELSILNNYLPKQLSEVELDDIISSYLQENEGVNMGTIMGYLKSNYSGQYDGKVASTVVKRLTT